MNIFNILNNREISIGIWLIIFFIAILIFISKKKSSIRFIPSLLKSLFHIKVLATFFSIFIYSAIIVTILYIIHYWDLSLLKDTIIWVVFVGISITVNSITTKDYYNLFKKIILDNIKIIIIFEFVFNLYSFPFWVEFFLVPFVVIIVLFDTVSGMDKKNACFSKFLKNLQILISISIFAYSIYQIVVDHKNFLTFQTLKDFALTPVLTIFFIPFIYIIVLFTSYEQIFVRLNVVPENHKDVKSYAKKEIFKYCLFSFKKVTNILKNNILELMRIRNKTDVDNFIHLLKSKNIIKFNNPT